MAWQDELQQASFKGIPFHWKQQTGSYGRNTATYEYPASDDVGTNDINRKARKFQVEGFFIGEDFNNQIKNLIQAVEAGGVGDLVHPYRGLLKVFASDLEITETPDESGMVRFSFSCIEAGKTKFPTITNDSKFKLNASASNLITAAKDRFQSVAKLSNVTQDIRNGSIGVFSGVFTKIKNVIGLTSLPYQFTTGGLSTIAEYTNNFANLNFSLNQVINPLASVTQSSGLYADLIIGTLGLINTTGKGAGDWSRKVLKPARDTAYPQVTEYTQANKDQNSNAAIATEFVNLVGIAVEVQSLLETTYPSRVEAIATRDDIIAQIDTLIERDQQKDTFVALRELKAQVILHAIPEDLKLQNVRTITVPYSSNSIVLAYNLYEDITKAADIVARNNIKHPGFISGDKELEVLVG